MVSRPHVIGPPSQHAEPIDSPTNSTADEDKRLADKFAAHRHLVPLVSQDPSVLFLNAASAPPSNLIVHEAIARYSAQALYDPAPHAGWRETREEARRLVARCINAEDDGATTIAFTRDTTEALGTFIRCVRFRPGDNVVVVDAEHPNQTLCWLALRGSAGLEVRQVPTIPEAGPGPGSGKDRIEPVTAETLRPYVDSRTRAIGISSMTFDAGQRNDVRGICAAYRARGIQVLADATQQVGFARLDVRALGVSAAAFSLHKGLNAPTGLGALYVSPAALRELGDPVPPVVSMEGVANLDQSLVVRVRGDDDEPLELRPGARRFEHANVSLVAVAAAAAFTRFYLDVLGPADVEAHLYGLTEGLGRECDRLGIRVVSPRERGERAPHIAVLALPREWGDYFRGPGGARVTMNRLGARVSFGFYNSVEDVRRFVRVLELGIAQGLGI
ncbi:PLP-dependent transferase [Daldinia caldariorum]|uniref:PLP-dependent transferase n=1 Tax=Daldinia caldariorum TaxID=326644 RepID=UPI00200749C5|nr:PLP-dependent transferase [Daldinia caldariorum]KAI1469402.1 PLP-dependent transferase [Daldinia caldariorum]